MRAFIRTWLSPVTGLLLLWPLWTVPLAAQSARDVELRPLVGSVAFFGELDGPTANLQASGAETAMENGIAYGLDLAVPGWFGDRWDVEATLRYMAGEFSTHDGRVSAGFATDYLIAGLGISRYLGDPRQTIVSVLSVTGGIKHYSIFSSDVMWGAGVALVLDTQLARFRFGLHDYMSVFRESDSANLQNDVMFTTAVAITPF